MIASSNNLRHVTRQTYRSPAGEKVPAPPKIYIQPYGTNYFIRADKWRQRRVYDAALCK